MSKIYADVIVNISHEAVDRPFQYIIPEDMREKLHEGMEVKVPFGSGNTLRKGYVVAISDKPSFDESKLKYIDSYNEKAVGFEGKTLELASWMKHRYGSTMIVAMQTVLPVKKKIQEKSFKNITCAVSEEELNNLISKCNSYTQAGRKLLLTQLLDIKTVPYSLVKEKLGVSDSVIKTLEKNGIINIESTREYRKPQVYDKYKNKEIILSDEQIAAATTIKDKMNQATLNGESTTTLLYGVTGSGKTEVYMELIAHAISKGQQAIVLIPEIALSFQTLMRFYARFGDRVSTIHSKLSDGEKYDQYEQAKNGKLDIIIGPRSALFTPFPNLGLIIIDEEHEGTYKSEKMPKYHAREVAEHIAKRENACLVLGSATPSLESFYKANNGEYGLVKLTKRNGDALLPDVEIVDMREELKAGNKTYFSKSLREKLTECLANGQQAMLFINRRGYVGFFSCRDCGFVLKCPHCDVSLSHHMSMGQGTGESMVCHYCGYTEPVKKICPKCNSKYFSGFKAGTEKIEQELKKSYPAISVLRMDADTTKGKDDYDKILSQFAERKADVLVGTQMIVKGHDFSHVTLVGVIAADMSLYAQDYQAQEKTFQLITQAAGRAGRGKLKGNVVIQTYRPEEYSLKHALNQDYDSFYEEEIMYRTLSGYPPTSHMLAIQFYGKDEDFVKNVANEMLIELNSKFKNNNKDISFLGPSAAIVSKIQDVYRYVIYAKDQSIDELIEVKDFIENMKNNPDKVNEYKMLQIHFDFDPTRSF